MDSFLMIRNFHCGLLFLCIVCVTWRGEVSPVQVHRHAEALHPLGPGHAPEAGHVQHAPAPLGGHVVGHVVHALLRHVTRNLKLVRRQGATFNREEKIVFYYTLIKVIFEIVKTLSYLS
jgi:hypothetical protein